MDPPGKLKKKKNIFWKTVSVAASEYSEKDCCSVECGCQVFFLMYVNFNIRRLEYHSLVVQLAVLGTYFHQRWEGRDTLSFSNDLFLSLFQKNRYCFTGDFQMMSTKM